MKKRKLKGKHNMGETVKGKEILGHPVGLFVLFATEMWERFSFYGMKALLLFYLTKYHLFSDDYGNLLVGSYAALVYALPVIGGFLADRYLGFRKAVIYGGILLVLGHLGMAFEGTEAVLGEVADVTEALAGYTELYYILFLMGIIFGGVLLLVSPLLKKLMHGIK